MKTTVNRCPNCNAQCPIEADYCRDCNAPLHKNREQDTDTINGVPTVQLSMMIEKKGGRYLEIFRKNESKMVFVHTNWAAAFMGIYWFFYRKMYWYGVAWLLLSCMITFAATLSTAAIFRDEVLAMEQQIDDDDMYNWENSFMEENVEDTGIASTTDHVDSKRNLTDLYAKNQMLSTKMDLCIIIPSLMFSIAVSLFADCLYRRHLLKSNSIDRSGISKISVLAALPLVVISNKVTSLLAALFIGAVSG